MNYMTPRQREILQMLVDGENIYWDGGRDAYIGNSRTSVAMIWRLVRRMWIKQEGQIAYASYWTISQTGREALNDSEANRRRYLEGQLGD